MILCIVRYQCQPNRKVFQNKRGCLWSAGHRRAGHIIPWPWHAKISPHHHPSGGLLSITLMIWSNLVRILSSSPARSDSTSIHLERAALQIFGKPLNWPTSSHVGFKYQILSKWSSFLKSCKASHTRYSPNEALFSSHVTYIVRLQMADIPKMKLFSRRGKLARRSGTSDKWGWRQSFSRPEAASLFGAGMSQVQHQTIGKGITAAKKN